MDIPPVVHVGHEERGDHPQPPHLRQLVPAQQLGVDHHRPQCRQIHAFPRRRIQRRQILGAGGIPVAVGQQLHSICPGSADHVQHLCVRQGAVAPVFLLPLIGPPQPSGTSLGRSIQKHLVPAQLEAPVILPDTLRKCLPGRLRSLRISVGNHIQLQGPVRQQGLIQGYQLPAQQPFLHGGDSVGGVQVLGLPVGRQKRLQRPHGHPLLELQKGVFLHVAGEGAVLPSDDASGGGRRLRSDTQPLQRRGVEHAHVAGLVADHHRVVRRRRIQAEPIRVAPLREQVVVVPLCRYPLPGRDALPPDVVPDPVLHVRPGGAALQRHLQKLVGHRRKVAVGVQKRRQQRPACQIHPADVDSRLVLHRRPAPHGGDPAVAHQQGLGIRAVPLQSADGAVFKENVHAIPPFLPVYRGRARPIPRRETPSIGQYAAKRREPCCT